MPLSEQQLSFLAPFEQMVGTGHVADVRAQAEIRRDIIRVSLAGIGRQRDNTAKLGFRTWAASSPNRSYPHPNAQKYAQPDDSLSTAAEDAEQIQTYALGLQIIEEATASHATKLVQDVVHGMFCIFGCSPATSKEVRAVQTSVEAFGSTIGSLAVVLHFCGIPSNAERRQEFGISPRAGFGDTLYTESLVNQVLHMNSIQAPMDRPLDPTANDLYQGFQYHPGIIGRLIKQAVGLGLTEAEARYVSRKSFTTPDRNLIGAANRKRRGGEVLSKHRRQHAEIVPSTPPKKSASAQPPPPERYPARPHRPAPRRQKPSPPEPIVPFSLWVHPARRTETEFTAVIKGIVESRSPLTTSHMIMRLLNEVKRTGLPTDTVTYIPGKGITFAAENTADYNGFRGGARKAIVAFHQRSNNEIDKSFWHVDGFFNGAG